MDAEKAQKQADKQISGMMTLGQMFQLITIDNNTASLQLRYTPGKVVFNGQEMSEEEFMSRAGRFVRQNTYSPLLIQRRAKFTCPAAVMTSTTSEVGLFPATVSSAIAENGAQSFCH